MKSFWMVGKVVTQKLIWQLEQEVKLSTRAIHNCNFYGYSDWAIRKKLVVRNIKSFGIEIRNEGNAVENSVNFLCSMEWEDF